MTLILRSTSAFHAVTPSPFLCAIMLAACLSPTRESRAQAIATATPLTLQGRWRVQRGTVAPWVTDRKLPPDVHAWLGRTIRFDANRVAGIDPLDCGGARYESTSMPPQGLFMGGLHAPAKPAAEALGFASFPVKGTRFNCDKGLFEFHYADAHTVMVAVNDVIWTLDRSPGALADSGTPGAFVQQFLEQHFAGDMGFDEKTFATKREYFSDRLTARVAHYFHQPASADEVPGIDGDPFTNSQEYPTRFSVGNETPSAAHARTVPGSVNVPVRMSDAWSSKRVTFVLEKRGTAWRISDVRYGKGEPSFWALLK